MKFGMEMVLEGGRFLVFWSGTPTSLYRMRKGGPQCLGDIPPAQWDYVTCLGPIWKDPCPVCFWSHGLSVSRGVYKIKNLVSVLNRYFLSIVHGHLDRALAQGSTYLSHHTNLKTNYFLKPHLNHSRQPQVTMASIGIFVSQVPLQLTNQTLNLTLLATQFHITKEEFG